VKPMPLCTSVARRTTSLPTSPRYADLDALAPELRWREWMGRAGAVIFASKETGLARGPGARCRPAMQSRFGHRGHPRRAARPTL
jgi:hypothetical protein